MFYLVWKDLLLAKKVNIFVLTLYAIFISLVAAKMPVFPEVLYGFCILMFVYITTIYANGYDEKSNSELILNSLPIERKDIVKGKYISIVINILICGLIIILSTNFFALGGLRFFTRTAGFVDIILSFILISIIFSLYYPIYFKLERSKTRLLNLALYLAIFFMPSFLSKFGRKILQSIPTETLSYLGSKFVILMLFTVSAFIYLVSYHLSKTFYLKRDF